MLTDFAFPPDAADEKPLPPASKEDYIIRLLEELVAQRQEGEGASRLLMPFEAGSDRRWPADLVANTEITIPFDAPHDAWIIYFRASATVTLRVWPGPSIPASGAIEIRNNTAVRIKSTSPHLTIRNTGSTDAHWFAIAASQAEVDFMALA